MGHRDLLVTHTYISAVRQPPLRTSHAKRPPLGGYVLTRKSYKSYKKECQEKNLPSRPDAGPFSSRHSAQLFERAPSIGEWSSLGRVLRFVSACEAKIRFLSPVVPFRCRDGACLWRIDTAAVKRSEPRNARQLRTRAPDDFLRDFCRGRPDTAASANL